VQRVAPRAAQIDQRGQFPWEIKDLAQHAIFALPFPREYGGLGASNLATVMAIEALSRSCATTGLLLAVQKFGAILLQLAGTEAQKRKYLPRLASGEWLVAFALTEAGSGSDAAAMRTRALRQADKYVLTGAKRFITNGGVAQVNFVFAMTDIKSV
jgi:alkylation response protein AidB-like acyl-CoA dehydrogenase